MPPLLEAGFARLVLLFPMRQRLNDIKALFSKAENVMSVTIILDRIGKTDSQRDCFCRDVHPVGGRRAISMLNRQDFMGNKVFVKEPTQKGGSIGEDGYHGP